MIDAQLRDVKERILEPVASAVGESFHPTTITLVGGVIGIFSAVSAGLGWFGLGLMLWLINRTLDGLDGTVARITGRQSALGGYVDVLVDTVVYTLVPVGLVAADPSLLSVAALVYLIGTFYLNSVSWIFLSAILERQRQGALMRGEKTTITMPTGWVEGAETVAFYVLFFLFPGELPLLFGLMGTAVLLTVVQRLVWAVKHLD